MEFELAQNKSYNTLMNYLERYWNSYASRREVVAGTVGTVVFVSAALALTGTRLGRSGKGEPTTYSRLPNKFRYLDESGNLVREIEYYRASARDLFDVSQTTNDLSKEITNPSGHTDSIIRRENAKSLTLAKIRLINTRAQGIIGIKDPRTVTFQESAFNLEDPTGFTIAVALVDQYFQSTFMEDLKSKFDWKSPPQRLASNNSLIWLAENIKFNQTAGSPVLRTEDLENLAQGLQALKAANHEIPHKAHIDVGYFPDQTAREAILINLNQFPPGSFDAGSVIAKHMLIREPSLLENYRQANPRLTQNEIEKALSDFLFAGQNLRRRILYARRHVSEPAAALEQKTYDISRNILGQEFAGRAVSRKILEYSEGDVVTIDDYERPFNHGILLRPRPTLNKETSWPYIEHGDTVRIIRGRAEVPDFKNLEIFTMFQVQAGTLSPVQEFVPRTNLPPGWVSDEWFSQKARN